MAIKYTIFLVLILFSLAMAAWMGRTPGIKRRERRAEQQRYKEEVLFNRHKSIPQYTATVVPSTPRTTVTSTPTCSTDSVAQSGTESVAQSGTESVAQSGTESVAQSGTESVAQSGTESRTLELILVFILLVLGTSIVISNLI